MENLAELIRTSQELLLVSAQDNQKISLIDPKTLAPIEIFQDDSSPSKFTLQVSNKYGHILAFQASKQILNIWNFNSKRLFLRVHVPERLSATYLSNSELYFIGGSIQGNIYVWSTLTGHLVKKFKGSQKKINRILFTHDDSFVVVGGEDGIINVYKSLEIFSNNNQLLQDKNKSLNEIRPIQQLLGHTDRVNDMVLGTSGRLYSVSRDKTMIIWDCLKGGKLLVQSCESEIKCLKVHPCEQWVYLGCANGKIYQNKIHSESDQYEVSAEQESSISQKKWKQRVLEGHRGELECLDLFLEQNLLVSGSKDGQIFFWNSEGQIQKKYSFYTSAITNIRLISRPKEFESINSTTTQTTFKRTIGFKPFSKFELTQQFLQQNQQSQQGEKKDLVKFVKSNGEFVTKKIKKQNKQSKLVSFVKNHYSMMQLGQTSTASQNNISKIMDQQQQQDRKQSDNEIMAEEFSIEDIKELIKQNKLLKQKNHDLFTNQYKLNEKQNRRNKINNNNQAN